jgi:hypothetical protein
VNLVDAIRRSDEFLWAAAELMDFDEAGSVRAARAMPGTGFRFIFR